MKTRNISILVLFLELLHLCTTEDTPNSRREGPLPAQDDVASSTNRENESISSNTTGVVRKGRDCSGQPQNVRGSFAEDEERGNIEEGRGLRYRYRSSNLRNRLGRRGHRYSYYGGNRNNFVCGFSCNSDLDCSLSVDGCRFCSFGFCNTRRDDNYYQYDSQCALPCTSSAFCQSRPGVCRFCNTISGRCNQLSTSQCGLSCSSSAFCQSQSGICTFCNLNSGRCESQITNQCGLSCANDPNFCLRSAGQCTQCNFSTLRCEDPSNVSQCNLSCSLNPNSCLNQSGPCTRCNPNTFRCENPNVSSQCGVDCSFDTNLCASSSGPCTFCNSNTLICEDPAASQCGIPCSGNPSICANLSGPCTLCDSSTLQCVAPDNNSQCDKQCFSDEGCSGSGDLGPCTRCSDNGVCVRPNDTNCFRGCSSNIDCSTFPGQCTLCNFGQCIQPNNVGNQCNSQCSFNSDCFNQFGPCTQCVGAIGGGLGRCEDPSIVRGECGSSCSSQADCEGGPCGVCNISTGQCVAALVNEGACVSDEASLRVALQSFRSSVVEICAGRTIVLTSEIFSSIDNKVLRCQYRSRTCGIQGSSASTHRLLNFSGNNIQVSHITFGNGRCSSGGNGGAVQITGSNSQLSDNAFYGNSCNTGSGGAVAIRSGNFFNNVGNGNTASRCPNVDLNGECANF